MEKNKILDLRNRTQLETAVFIIAQYECLSLDGEFIPDEETWKLVKLLTTVSHEELCGFFEEQLDAGAALAYFAEYGIASFITPNGDWYNYTYEGWFVTV